MKLVLFQIIVLLLAIQPSKAQLTGDAIVGVWLTSGNEPAKIEIYKSAKRNSGRIVWLQNPLTNGKEKLDVNNPEAEKRNRQVIGLPKAVRPILKAVVV